MAKVISINTANISAANKTRIQKAIFANFKTDFSLAAHTDVTTAHIRTFLEKQLKRLVEKSEYEVVNKTFAASFSDVPLES